MRDEEDHVPQRGKKYLAVLERVDRERAYAPREALQLVKDNVVTKFDPTVNIAVRLGVDPRKADQMVRGALVLPKGTGTTARVAVIAVGEQAAETTAAGADVVGGDEVIEQLSKGELIDELDTIIATPDQMGKLGRLGKLLGPRGLMPNPKSGTVTTDVGKAVRESKAGKVEYRVDRQGNIHAVLGKASFPLEDLVDNYQALVDEIVRARPASAKGRYLRNVTVSSAMGPGIRVDAAKGRDADDASVA